MPRLRRRHPGVAKRVIPAQVTSFVLDTTCFHGGTFGPNSPGFSRFFELADELGCRFIIPEIVLQEWVRQARGNLKAWSDDASALLAKHASMIGKVVPPIALLSNAKASAETLEAYFRKRLGEQGVIIAPFPEVDLTALVQRDLANEPPFHNGAGLRDTLIWHTVLAEAAQGQSVRFITNNKRDFGTEAGLHPNLLAEAERIGTNRVSILPTIGAAIQWLTATFLAPVETLVNKPVAAAFGEPERHHLEALISAAIGWMGRPLDWLLVLPTGWLAADVVSVILGPIEKAAKLDGATFATIPFDANVLSFANRGNHDSPIILRVQAKVQVLVTEAKGMEILGFIPGAIPETTVGADAVRAKTFYLDKRLEYYEDLRQDAEDDARREWEDLRRDSQDLHDDGRG